jgi:ABC-type Fe3+/spermidine/putrescine transport system ATPase subunit
VYEQPSTTFVADFLGVSNLLDAEATADGGACTLRIGERSFRAEQGETAARGRVRAMIRPERIDVEPQGTAGDNRLPGLVERAVFLGGMHEVHVRVLGGDLLRATIPNDGRPGAVALEEGTAVMLHLPPESLRVLTPSEPPRAPAAAEPVGA